MRGNRGFTIIELMVTIAVLAIIALMAAPSMSDFIEKQRLNSSERELVNAISQTRSQSVFNRSDLLLALNRSSATATTINWTPKNNSTLTVNSIADGVVGGSIAVNTITFTSTGQISSLNSDIKMSICNFKIKKQKNIILTRLGAVFVQPEGTC